MAGLPEYEREREARRLAESYVEFLQGTIRTLRADRDRERARLRPLLERIEDAMTDWPLFVESDPRREEIGEILADLRRELGKEE